jgi:hypothetical protein
LIGLLFYLFFLFPVFQDILTQRELLILIVFDLNYQHYETQFSLDSPGAILALKRLIFVFTSITLIMCMAVNVVEAQQVQTQAQKQSVRGKVTDETGKPLQDVSITIKGSTKGVVTNEKGEYNIDVPETSTKILVFSFVGMEQQEIKIENQKEISITLKPAEKSEQEVVVVGYGTQRRKNLTGAIQKISGDEIVNRPASNVSSLLQGEATGITF